MTEDSSPRTLYVGNLSSHVTEDLLIALFGQIGECKSCKIIHEPGNDPYAFVEFSESHSAASALSAMNKRNCLGKEMKVNWATTSGGHQAKLESSKFIFSEHYHIFVGDLAPDIDQQTLRDAFASYGEISDTKIMKDPHTLVHKGYGFISFVNKADAETAISAMNGQWLGTRKIRTNWATRKVQPGGEQGALGGPPGQKYAHKLDYNEVWNRSSDTNTTVYCGGINNLTDEVVRNTFGVYGQITGIHPFPDRGYSFIRFATKEAACSAICGVHGMEVNGGVAKCSWGKENIDITAGSGGPSMGGGGLYGSQGSGGANVLQNISSLQSAASQIAPGGTPNSNWSAANYQWAAGAGAYPQNAFNQWFQQTGYNGQAYQNAMMQQQGWGVMPAATGAAGANPQYQMGQYQQGANGQKS